MSRKNCDSSFMSLGKAVSSPLMHGPRPGARGFSGPRTVRAKTFIYGLQNQSALSCRVPQPPALTRKCFFNVGCRTERALVTRICCVYWDGDA